MSHTTAVLGLVIKQARDRFGLSQEELAASAGLNRTFIGEIERGETNPSFETLCRIADALNTKLSEIIIHYEESYSKKPD